MGKIGNFSCRQSLNICTPHAIFVQIKCIQVYTYSIRGYPCLYLDYMLLNPVMGDMCRTVRSRSIKAPQICMGSV